jgi:hypothetical protein
MKSPDDWIKEAVAETPRPVLDALTVYFATSHQTAEDLLGFLLSEGFKIVDDDKKRGP